MHAAFVADEIWGFMPEPARTKKQKKKHTPHTQQRHRSSNRCWSCRNPATPRRRPAPVKARLTTCLVLGWLCLCYCSCATHAPIHMSTFLYKTHPCLLPKQLDSPHSSDLLLIAPPPGVHPRTMKGGGVYCVAGAFLRFCFVTRGRLLRNVVNFAENSTPGRLLRSRIITVLLSAANCHHAVRDA